MHYRSISRDVTAAILVYQSNETAAMSSPSQSSEYSQKVKTFFGVP